MKFDIIVLVFLLASPISLVCSSNSATRNSESIPTKPNVFVKRLYNFNQSDSNSTNMILSERMDSQSTDSLENSSRLELKLQEENIGNKPQQHSSNLKLAGSANFSFIIISPNVSMTNDDILLPMHSVDSAESSRQLSSSIDLFTTGALQIRPNEGIITKISHNSVGEVISKFKSNTTDPVEVKHQIKSNGSNRQYFKTRKKDANELKPNNSRTYASKTIDVCSEKISRKLKVVDNSYANCSIKPSCNSAKNCCHSEDLVKFSDEMSIIFNYENSIFDMVIEMIFDGHCYFHSVGSKEIGFDTIPNRQNSNNSTQFIKLNIRMEKHKRDVLHDYYSIFIVRYDITINMTGIKLSEFVPDEITSAKKISCYSINEKVTPYYKSTKFQMYFKIRRGVDYLALSGHDEKCLSIKNNIGKIIHFILK